MSFLRPEELPYGVYYCRVCCELRACDVAVGSSRTDPDCALECLTCGERVGEEIDVRGCYPLPDRVERRQTMTAQQREAGRALGRRLALGHFADELEAQNATELGAPVVPAPGYRERAAADLARLKGQQK